MESEKSGSFALGSRLLLAVEFSVLFVILPVLATVAGWNRQVPLFPAIWVIFLYCLIALLRDPRFDRSSLWTLSGLSRHARLVLIPVLVAAPFLAWVTLQWDPERFLVLVRERPRVWVIVMIFYPLLSVIPQGVIFRSFFFQRYQSLFGAGWGSILASGVAFSLAHVIFENWIAPTLTLAGGLLFAWTYARTRSAFAASVQHALFGCYLMTIGLGWYFYTGSMAAGS